MLPMKSNYVLPITIVIAGALIAGGVFLAGKGSTQTGDNGKTMTQNARAYSPGTDHILGNPNAPVKVVEYMDLECPHCKVFNATMHQLMDYYGPSGKVAWVTRPFPLAQIHSKAPQEAQAAECAAQLGGDRAYYAFIDKVFDVTPSDNGLDLAQLPIIAKGIGLDQTAFNTCVSSNKYAQKVSDSYTEAIAAGGQGTPYSLIFVGNQLVPGGNLSGAQAYSDMRAAIDAVLQSTNNTVTASTTTQ